MIDFHVSRPVRRRMVVAEALRAPGAVVGMLVDGKPIRVEAPEVTVFAGAVPVILDAVSNWWDAQGSDRWPDARLTPPTRLPWPKVWCEWIERKDSERADWSDMVARIKQLNPEDQVDEKSVATAMQAVPTALLLQEVPQRNIGWLCRHVLGGDVPEIWHGATHAISGRLFTLCRNGDVVMGPAIAAAAIDHERWVGRGGVPVTFHEDGTVFLVQAGMRPTTDAVGSLFVVWHLFNALLQVRGTVAVDVPFSRSTRRAASRAQDAALPWVRYKTLHVDLPTKKGQDVPSQLGPQRGVPLHLVRASIADYRQGRGLFGKYKELVWRPSHLRGHQHLGAIAKVYEAGKVG